jgi:hypothetical protein
MFLDAHEAFPDCSLRAYLTGRAALFCRVNHDASTMWRAKPRARIGSITLTIRLVAMKWHTLLKVSPLPSTMSIKFAVKCTHRNEIRKNPDKLSMVFFPIDEVKKLLIIYALF